MLAWRSLPKGSTVLSTWAAGVPHDRVCLISWGHNRLFHWFRGSSGRAQNSVDWLKTFSMLSKNLTPISRRTLFAPWRIRSKILPEERSQRKVELFWWWIQECSIALHFFILHNYYWLYHAVVMLYYIGTFDLFFFFHIKRLFLPPNITAKPIVRPLWNLHHETINVWRSYAFTLLPFSYLEFQAKWWYFFSFLL